MPIIKIRHSSHVKKQDSLDTSNKTDIELGVRNLFNNNYLVSTNINAYYTVQSGMFMRPRQVTAAIRFTF